MTTGPCPGKRQSSENGCPSTSARVEKNSAGEELRTAPRKQPRTSASKGPAMPASSAPHSGNACRVATSAGAFPVGARARAGATNGGGVASWSALIGSGTPAVTPPPAVTLTATPTAVPFVSRTIAWATVGSGAGHGGTAHSSCHWTSTRLAGPVLGGSAASDASTASLQSRSLGSGNAPSSQIAVTDANASGDTEELGASAVGCRAGVGLWVVAGEEEDGSPADASGVPGRVGASQPATSRTARRAAPSARPAMTYRARSLRRSPSTPGPR